MTLTVEDGTGVTNADALVSLAAWKTYATARGWSYSAYSDTDDLEPAIRRASWFVSDHFSWKGSPVFQRDQVFQWPRYNVYDRNNEHVDSDTIPREVTDAVCEAAWRETQEPGALSPDVTLTDRIKMEKIGPLTFEYASVPYDPNAARPAITILHDIVRGLLKSGSNPHVGRAVRA